MKIIDRYSSDSKENALHSALVVLLVALMGMSVPFEWMGAYIGNVLASAIVRYVFGAVGVVLVLMYGFHGQFKLSKRTLGGAIAFAAAMLVAFCNFPYHSLASGKAQYIADGGKLAAYIAFCISVGFFEEIFFRGLIFPLVMKRFKERKHGVLIAILGTSALFGLVHIINLFGGMGIGGVIRQIGYSTLIGAICACLYYYSGCIWYAIFFHAAFNFGGLMTDYGIISGSIWSLPEIIAMVIAGVAAGAYLLFKFLKVSAKEQKEDSKI